jgi:hypothetical protein
MTGPEHYQAAEDLLSQPWLDDPHARSFIARAQVHATLALAAATALSHGVDAGSRHAWSEAAS